MLPPEDPVGSENIDDSTGITGYAEWMLEEKGGLHFTIGTFFQEGVEASCAWMQRPDGAVRTQGWILGKDEFPRTPPTVVCDSGLLRALTLARGRLPKHREDKEPDYIMIRGGNMGAIRQLRSWFANRTLRLSSPMASEVEVQLREIAPRL